MKLRGLARDCGVLAGGAAVVALDGSEVSVSVAVSFKSAVEILDSCLCELLDIFPLYNSVNIGKIIYHVQKTSHITVINPLGFEGFD